MKRKLLTYTISIILVEALGFCVGMITRSGTKIYADTINKPVLSPPGILFPIAWTILYGLMGFAIARILLSNSENAKKTSVILFVTQLILNLAWCFIFFEIQNFIFALIELLAMLILVICMIATFKKVDKVACYTQIPYLIWLCFATYLNIGVVVLN